MIEHGYSKSKYDSCAYHQNLNYDSFIYLLLYVDNILIAVKEICEVDKLKAQAEIRVWDERFESNKENFGNENSQD